MASLTVPKPKYCVIFCHGSGDTGRGVASYVQAVTPPDTLARLRSEGVVFEFPSATPRPYSLWGGAEASIWFDRNGGMEPSNPEATASVLASVSQLEALIDDAMARHGLPAEKIALGGFSMGGGISLQVMARAKHCLGAVFALSSYLCDDSAAYKEFSAGKAETQAAALAPANEEAAAEGAAPAPRVPVFIAHGADDDFVLPAWGAATAKRLEGFGVPVKFTTIEGIKHEMNPEELGLLFEWLGGVLGF